MKQRFVRRPRRVDVPSGGRFSRVGRFSRGNGFSRGGGRFGGGFRGGSGGFRGGNGGGGGSVRQRIVRLMLVFGVIVLALLLLVAS
ncbi:hypothetical protein ACFXPE_03200, partial [Streptomyces scopuliridis]|uniref:hypothetical protein n=1 Tax=Streptomyces scopuliridis TaxID=452529 RepID=UPI0036B2857A